MALLLALSLLFAAPASPLADRVLVLAGTQDATDAENLGPLRPGFLDALRIELAGSARVQVGPRVAGDSSSTRIENARRQLGTDLRLVVWLESDGPDLILYAVGYRNGRTVVETFRQPSTGGHDSDRAFALKVHEVLDHLRLGGRRARRSQELDPAAKRLATSPTDGATSLIAEAELVTRGLRSRAGGQLGAGIGVAGGMRRSRRSTHLYALAYLASDVSARAEAGRIDASEWGLASGVRVLIHRRRVDLGAGLEIAGRRLDARGTAENGLDGSHRAWFASLSPFAELRYPLTSSLHLRAAVGLEVALTQPRFSLQGSTVLEFGRLRQRIDVSLVLRLL